MRKAIKRSRDPEAAAEQDTAVLTYMQAMKRPQPHPQSESTHEPQPG
jgi:hypothetical protein